ncbi:hypothetical protein E4T56_gene17066 [Termitomyces sp. T112]|nr:hypothetical protein E4T56_gene17066 [Termitomyces sp. T112]KNZ79846.1 hypothetical protein J132_08504 [Termitomyces sp. J132]
MALSDETRELISRVLESLPVLTAEDIPDDEDSCPICLIPFSSLFLDNTDDNCGVTKLAACNHIFCRKDLTQWIQSLHGNCPTCRHIFLDIRPPSDSDNESSDGGEYIPDEDFDDEDDGFMDTDGFSDAIGYTTDDMEYDGHEWDENDNRDTDMEDIEITGGVDDESEWGLTDGESSLASEDVNIPFIMNEADEVHHAGGAEVQVGITLADQHSSDDLNEPGQDK